MLDESVSQSVGRSVGGDAGVHPGGGLYLRRGGVREHELAVGVADAVEVGHDLAALLGQHAHLLVHLFVRRLRM